MFTHPPRRQNDAWPDASGASAPGAASIPYPGAASIPYPGAALNQLFGHYTR